MVVQQMFRLCWAGMVALCAEAVIGEEAFVGVTVTVESGTNTLAQALADSGQTLGNADLLKLGAGTLDLGSNPGYTGNIHVKEGVAFAALTAEGGVEGLPTLLDNSSRYQRRLGTSADGRTLLLYASSGLMVIVR